MVMLDVVNDLRDPEAVDQKDEHPRIPLQKKKRNIVNTESEKGVDDFENELSQPLHGQ